MANDWLTRAICLGRMTHCASFSILWFMEIFTSFYTIHKRYLLSFSLAISVVSQLFHVSFPNITLIQLSQSNKNVQILNSVSKKIKLKWKGLAAPTFSFTMIPHNVVTARRALSFSLWSPMQEGTIVVLSDMWRCTGTSPQSYGGDTSVLWSYPGSDILDWAVWKTWKQWCGKDNCCK